MKKIIIVENLRKHSQEMMKRLDYDIEHNIVTKGHFMEIETFYKIFSPERIRLLQRVNRNKIKNINQLAKEMNKPYEVVFKNLKMLESYGLIKFDKTQKNRVPHIAHKLDVEFFPKLAQT